MRFKLKLKKSRQYNVTSRSLFVISVEHLLDSSSNVECTLSSVSTGQECLENVCQRLSINQPEFFGLRYLTKGYTNDYRWVDLDLPLSRQLEKYAACPRLFLRVMYYIVSGVQLITDEMTRYYYFLQIKGDVVDGRINCDPKQAVVLAICARQAEYDSHQKDQHTVDYLKTMLPFPKRLIEAGLSEKLTEEVLQQNVELTSMAQSKAEELFIMTCQQLEGYGQERFPAKDKLGNDVLLGNSVLGVSVYIVDDESMNPNGRSRMYRWGDITNVLNLKQSFILECNPPENSCEFTLQDAESGRYLWKLCVLRHKFFMKYENHFNQPSSANALTIFQNFVEQKSASTVSLINKEMNGTDSARHSQMDSCDNLLLLDSRLHNPGNSVQHWRNSDQQLARDLRQRWRSQDSVVIPPVVNQHRSYSNLHLQTGYGPLMNGNATVHPNQNHQMVTSTFNWQPMNSKLAGSNISLNNRMEGSSSCVDLSNNIPPQHQSVGNLISNSCTNVHVFNDKDQLKTLLPVYRPAPDYETAIRQKYHRPSTGDLYSGSHPDVHQALMLQQHQKQLPAQQHFPDVAQSAIYQRNGGAQYLANGNSALESMNHRFRMMRINNGNLIEEGIKPPPPYPSPNRLSSTSTPDLALISHKSLLLGCRGSYVSGSSPDLVSSRTFLNNHLMHLHQTPGYLNSSTTVIPQNYYPVANGVGQGSGGEGPSTNTSVKMRHSQQYFPHDTYDGNLNYLDQATSSTGNLYVGGLETNNDLDKQQIRMQHQQQQKQLNNSTNNLNVSQPNLQILLQQQQQQELQIKSSARELNNGGGGGITAAAASTSGSVASSSSVVVVSGGDIEPIYENIPLSLNGNNSGATNNNGNNSEMNQPSAASSSSAALSATISVQKTTEVMRDRTSSVQSAPGVMRHVERDSGGSSRRSSNSGTTTKVQLEESQLRDNFPHPSQSQSQNQQQIHRPISKTLSNPVSNPSNVFQNDGEVVFVSTINDSVVRKTTDRMTFEQDKSLLNRSHSANLLDSSVTTIDSGNISASTSNASIATKEKKKGIWGLLSRSKNSSSLGGSAKQKSATLGREKVKNKNLSLLTKDEEDNLKHRWSTGLPKMQPLPANISKEQLCQLLEQKLNDEQLFIEFERIPKRKDNAKYECALHEENKNKNWDPNFLPHDDNRVRLLPTRNNRLGYVNASHLTATVGTKQRFYIVAQSPFDAETTNTFWQCVWEADVYLLIQLSNEHQYVPTSTDKCLECGQYQVWKEFSQKTDYYVTSKLRIYHMQNKRYRSVWYIHYSDWSDQNIPTNIGPFLSFLEELSSVRMASVNEIPPGHNTNPPVLIHCSGGGGRAGVTLAADLLLFTLDHNQDLDIPRVVGQLRHQRDNIVASLAQYKFIYALLIHYLKQTRLI